MVSILAPKTGRYCDIGKQRDFKSCAKNNTFGVLETVHILIGVRVTLQ